MRASIFVFLAPNYGGPQVHTEFKSLTPNSNHSHRIKLTQTKFKSLTPNSNHSNRIQITHTEFKSLTPNSNGRMPGKSRNLECGTGNGTGGEINECFKLRSMIMIIRGSLLRKGTNAKPGKGGGGGTRDFK